MRFAGISAFARYCLLLAGLVIAGGGAWPAPAQQHPTINQAPAAKPSDAAPDTREVNVPVIVYDKKGDVVQNLTKDSFTLQVDKKPQTIQSFSLATDVPLSVGLLVDTSASQREAIQDERTASAAFLDDILSGPAGRDSAFVIQFAEQTDLLQDTTSSKPKLEAALKQLQTSSLCRGCKVRRYACPERQGAWREFWREFRRDEA